jgi:hypothetical protein
VSRILGCFTALALVSLPALADQPTAPPETLIRLTVEPMPAPKPALRYQLLPEFKELNPGNPIHGYLRCFGEQQNFFFNKETCDRRDKLLTMPLKELPARELEDYGRNALSQADWAARLDKPDWQILLKVKSDGIGLLLPDVQQMRMLANALKVRFRAEVALHRYDDALRTAKTMFALSRHMNEHPTLIGGLVGIAIAYVAIGPLEEMLEQPGCPNLYWALTNLPRPMSSADIGMSVERVVIQSEFHELDDSAAMSADQLQKLIAHIDRIKQLENPPVKTTTRAWLDQRIKQPGAIDVARGRLIAFGIPEERVRQFPVDQVLILDGVWAFEERRDETLKLMNLPPWQFEKLLPTTKSEGEGLFDLLIPALHKVRRAHGRLEQRIALLRHVEALRLYAADHDGKLPATLADVAVPLPDDPFTGKPFLYRVEGATAHLRGTPPPGEEKNPGFNIHYEVTIHK